MHQMNTRQETSNTANHLPPLGFRYSCALNGGNTGLSHYILLDKPARRGE